MGWNRKEGKGNKDFKRGEASWARVGAIKKEGELELWLRTWLNAGFPYCNGRLHKKDLILLGSSEQT